MKQKQFNPKFDTTIQKFFDIISNTLRPGTVENYSIAIKDFTDFISLHYPDVAKFSDLKRSPHIETWLSHLVARNLSKGTRNLTIICLRRFLDDMYQWDWPDAPKHSLIVSRDIPNPDNRLPKPLTPEDDRILQDSLRKHKSRSALALLLLRKTGMRIGELRDLEVHCLERLPDNQFLLHVPLGKLHTERVIPVDNETADIIEQLKNSREILLPLTNQRTGKPAQFLLITKYWKQPGYSGLRLALALFAKKAGITSRVTPHMLRHTYATELSRANISLPALMRLLGHKNVNMSLRYTDVTQQDLQNVYGQAMKKSNSLHLLNKKQDENTENKPDLVQQLNDLITGLNSIRKDSQQNINNKKLQRISERLRRAQQDIKDTLTPTS